MGMHVKVTADHFVLQTLGTSQDNPGPLRQRLRCLQPRCECRKFRSFSLCQRHRFQPSTRHACPPSVSGRKPRKSRRIVPSADFESLI